jgi:dihydrodipicolinate synthase/N-acetylneuraminate lyase
VASSTTKLQGIITPLVTPLSNSGKLDNGGLERLVEHVLNGGVHGLFVLGSTGEGPSLSVDLRCDVVRAVTRAAGNRVPVLVNVSDTALTHCLQLSEEAARADASGLAISPPCYYPLDQRQLFEYTRKVCENSPLPVFLYNVPQYAHNRFEPETVRELSYLPNVAGIKNSDGSLQYLETIRNGVSHRSDFTLLVGNEEILVPALRSGADGGVCGGANMFPRLFVRLFHAAKNGSYVEAEATQDLIVRVSKAVYTVGPRETSYLRGLKHALSLLALIDGHLAEPLQQFDAAQRTEVEERLRSLVDEVTAEFQMDDPLSFPVERKS